MNKYKTLDFTHYLCYSEYRKMVSVLANGYSPYINYYKKVTDLVWRLRAVTFLFA